MSKKLKRYKIRGRFITLHSGIVERVRIVIAKNKKEARKKVKGIDYVRSIEEC